MRYLNRVVLRTPESVELDFTLAGIGNRTLALILDYLIWVIALVVLIFLSLFLWSQIELSFSSEVLAVLREWLGAIVLLSLFATYVGYFVLFETLWQGQTPGKRWVGIRVVQQTGKPAGLVQALLRSLFRPVDDLFFLGALLLIFGKQEKRVGDLLAGTLVVQEAEKQRDAGATVSSDARSKAKQLLEVVNVERMTPDDFAVIRSFLVRRQRFTTLARQEVTTELAQEFSQALGLVEVPLEMPPELFLEALYAAYQRSGRR
jgi:uncharacterized RDD family membrane protein YckC